MPTFATLMDFSQLALVILPLRDHILGFLRISFVRWQVADLSPKPQIGGPVYHIYNSLGTVAQCPKHRVHIIIPFCDMSGLQWDRCFACSLHGEHIYFNWTESDFILTNGENLLRLKGRWPCVHKCCAGKHITRGFQGKTVDRNSVGGLFVCVCVWVCVCVC